MAYCPFADLSRKRNYCYCVSPLNPDIKSGEYSASDLGVAYKRCVNGEKYNYTVEDCPFNPMNKNHL